MTLTGTWHHGLVADWWRSQRRRAGGGLLRAVVERAQPALDAGCGAGRLLLPWLRAGYDVDGCDVSEDMVESCRTLGRAQGLEPNVWARRYTSCPRRAATARSSSAGCSASAAPVSRTSRRCTACTTAWSPAGRYCSTTSCHTPTATAGRRGRRRPRAGCRRVAATGRAAPSVGRKRARAPHPRSSSGPVDQTLVLEIQARASGSTTPRSPARFTRSRCACTSTAS